MVQRRVRSLLAPYGKARKQHGSGLGKTRYVVELVAQLGGQLPPAEAVL